MKVFFSIVGVFASLFLIGFLINQYELTNRQIFAPQYEQLRNDVFHHSQAYTDGVKRDIAHAQVEYASATTEDAKSAICALVREEVSESGTAFLGNDLAAFVTTCQNRK